MSKPINAKIDPISKISIIGKIIRPISAIRIRAIPAIAILIGIAIAIGIVIHGGDII